MSWRRRGFAVLGAAVAVAVACLAAVPAAEAAVSPFAQARQAALAGRHPDAIQLLRVHLSAAPRDAAAWVWLGASYYQLKQYQPAATAFSNAVWLARSPDMALWQGAAYVALGRPDAARTAFMYAARNGRPQTRFVAGQWLRALQGRVVAVLSEPARPEAYAHVVRWYNPRLSAGQVDAIVRSVLFYSDRFGVDPRLMMALIAIESGFQITARSPVGAYGLGQLMPATWRSIGVHPADPVANIYASVRVLRSNLDRFGFNIPLALAAYNAGKGSVERYGGIPPYSETQWYVRNVLALYLHLRGS
ncbi:MAG TPA: lytic transglycosylase domain-containing protein [bacterium]|nr:lytic transglycosylase domain-containing protein [bacterium]